MEKRQMGVSSSWRRVANGQGDKIAHAKNADVATAPELSYPVHMMHLSHGLQ